MKFTKTTHTKDGCEWKKRILYAFPENILEFLCMNFKLDYRRIDLDESCYERNVNEPDDSHGAFMKEFVFNQPMYMKDGRIQEDLMEDDNVELYLEKDKNKT